MIKIQSVIAALVLWLWCAPLFAQVSEVPQAAQSMLAQSAPGASMLQIKNGNAGIPAFNMTVNPDGSEDYSITLQILAVMTALGFLPAIVILMTSFTRIVVVMAILRQALGLQQTPSNQIIVGIAMFLTFFIMSPVIEKMNSDALTP
ncbi:MAG: flagellar type III secretion system pore protein FliP, partial [Enterovibrio sp.]